MAIPLLCFDELWRDHIISVRCIVFSPCLPTAVKALRNTIDFKPWEVESVESGSQRGLLVRCSEIHLRFKAPTLFHGNLVVGLHSSHRRL